MCTRGGTGSSLGQKLPLSQNYLVCKKRKKTTRKKWEKGHRKPRFATDITTFREKSSVCPQGPETEFPVSLN